jgi:hypothetical protein
MMALLLKVWGSVVCTPYSTHGLFVCSFFF